MNHLRNNLLAAFVVAFALSAASSLANPPRYPVQPVEVAPVIDGKLDDACWSSLPSAGLFVNKNSKPVTSFLEVDYRFLPVPSAVSASVRIQAMRDEYESGCLRVFALNGSCTVLPVVGDLKGPGGAVLPASAFDVRVLKGRYQAGKGGFQDPSGVGVWANVLAIAKDPAAAKAHASKNREIVLQRQAETMAIVGRM